MVKLMDNPNLQNDKHRRENYFQLIFSGISIINEIFFHYQDYEAGNVNKGGYIYKNGVAP